MGFAGRASSCSESAEYRWDFWPVQRQGTERCMMYFGDNAGKVDSSCDVSSHTNINAVS